MHHHLDRHHSSSKQVLKILEVESVRFHKIPQNLKKEFREIVLQLSFKSVVSLVKVTKIGRVVKNRPGGCVGRV